MTDKQVGEAWYGATRCYTCNGEMIKRLIRKLVDERDDMYYEKGSCRRAIDDFGIPEETWE